jgi:hypothetical protein
LLREQVGDGRGWDLVQVPELVQLARLVRDVVLVVVGKTILK